MLKDYSLNFLIPSLAQRSVVLQELLVIEFDGLEHSPIQIDAADHGLEVCNIFLANLFISLVKASYEVSIMTAVILYWNGY